jgi:hypothetical protein
MQVVKREGGRDGLFETVTGWERKTKRGFREREVGERVRVILTTRIERKRWYM